MANLAQNGAPTVVKRPTVAFLLSLVSGVGMITFSSGLAAYTQYYFITTVLVQNSFILGLGIILVGALAYLRPDEHSAWGLVIITLGVSEIVLVTNVSSSIPLLQISVIGPGAGVFAIVAGALAVTFRP